MQKKPFRLTLWFKKGEFDADLAAAAAAADDALAPGAVDLLPAEDRYLDDGSVTRDDCKTYSLRTGRTTYLPRFEGGGTIAGNADVAPLVEDLKRGRRFALAVLGAATAAAGAMLAVYML